MRTGPSRRRAGFSGAPSLPAPRWPAMKRKAAGFLRSPRLQSGGRSPRAPADARCWAPSLARAACSPTPLPAPGGNFSLMAGPSQPSPAGIFRVRPLRPVRPLPAGTGSPDGVLARLQVLRRVATLVAGTAPAGRRPLAPRHGSDLLPLRLDSPCSRVTRFVVPPAQEALRALTMPARFPPPRFPLRTPPVCRKGLAAGVARRESPSRPGLRSSSHYPLGNCVGGRFETFRPPDSTRARFLIGARRTVPGSCRRPVMNPGRRNW